MLQGIVWRTEAKSFTLPEPYVQQKKMLLLDEPVAGLDPKAAKENVLF